MYRFFFFFSSRRRHTRFDCDWSSDVCSSDLSSSARRQGGRSSGWILWALRCRRARGRRAASPSRGRPIDRKSVVEGKRGDLGGRRIIKKKKKEEKDSRSTRQTLTMH